MISFSRGGSRCGGAGGGLALGVGLAITTLAGIHDREGGEACLLVSVVAPLGVVVGLICGALIGWRRSAD